MTKNDEEVLEEYKKVINIYKYKLNVYNFDSKILAIFQEEKELLKSWIEPTKKLEAKLLYSFYVDYKQNYVKDTVEIDEVNMNKIGNVETFHQKCDNKPDILVLANQKMKYLEVLLPCILLIKIIMVMIIKVFYFL